MAKPVKQLLRSTLRATLHTGQRKRLALARVAARRPSASLRKLPSFLILGAQRCGTSSVHQYLAAHPDVCRPLRKEVAFYSRYWSRGLPWYRCHFPLRIDGRVSLDTTPDYLLDPRSPARVASVQPDIPLVVLLRDPVERAFSGYKHIDAIGIEPLSFEQALEAEAERLEAAASGDHLANEFFRFSYARRGMYAEQLQGWFRYFGRDRVLVLFAEEFYADPAGTLHQIEDFVGLKRWVPPAFENWSYRNKKTASTRKSAAMTPETHAHLSAIFAGPNSELASLLGRELPWRAAG